MLEVRDIMAGYGGIRVLKGLDLYVKEDEIVTLIGANGAGKTTLLRVVSGVIQANKGKVMFEGEDITKLSPHRIVRHGICLVPEGREIFSTMSVFENLLMGAFIRPSATLESSLETVYQMFPILRKRQGQLGKTLSGGEQQMLAIGRALMAQPKLFMMDEPSLGLAPMLVNEVFQKIDQLKTTHVAILLVEQNARKALQVADRGYVLEVGKIVLKGSGTELASNKQVYEAYLGGKGPG